MMLLLQLLLLQLLLMLDGTLCHTACSAFSSAENSTTVTCFFGKDISQQGFSVLFFKTAHSDGALVLACNRRSTGGLICDKGKGVYFDEHQLVKYQLTLTRASSDSPVGVEYLCQMVPGGGELVNRCNVIRSRTLPASTTPKPHMAADKDGNATLVILTIFFIIFIIIIVSAVVFCGILYFKRENVHQRYTEFAIGMWSGRGKVPEETGSKDASALEKGKREKIPEGWAAYYYNLGWRQCQKEEHDSNEGDKTDVGSSKDPHREKSYRGYREEPRDPEGAASTQPLLGESRVHQERAAVAVFGTSKDQGDTFHDAKEGRIELKPLDASNLLVKREQQSSSQAEQQGAHTETKQEREEAEKKANEEAEKTAKAAKTAEKKAIEAAKTAEKKAREAALIKKKGGAEKAERTARAAEEAEKIAIEAANEAERTAREAAEKAQIKARQAAVTAFEKSRQLEEIKEKGATQRAEKKAREEAEKAQRAAEEADRKAKEAADKADKIAREAADKADKIAREAADKADKIAREAADKAEKHAREAAAKQAKANQ